ncbi:MAG: hypothetical protein GY696_39525, partial [Gammaproteobacteria bacterium]|nr:hypothetical protein [Gammaproteobacteria bacterium]
MFIASGREPNSFDVTIDLSSLSQRCLPKKDLVLRCKLPLVEESLGDKNNKLCFGKVSIVGDPMSTAVRYAKGQISSEAQAGNLGVKTNTKTLLSPIRHVSITTNPNAGNPLKAEEIRTISSKERLPNPESDLNGETSSGRGGKEANANSNSDTVSRAMVEFKPSQRLSNGFERGNYAHMNETRSKVSNSLSAIVCLIYIVIAGKKWLQAKSTETGSLSMCIFWFSFCGIAQADGARRERSDAKRHGSYVNMQYGAVMSPAGFVFQSKEAVHIPLVIRLGDSQWTQEYADTSTPRKMWTNKTPCVEKKSADGKIIPCVESETMPPCPFKEGFLDETYKIRKEFLHTYARLFDKPMYHEILDRFCDKSPLLCANTTQTVGEKDTLMDDPFRSWNRSPTDPETKWSHGHRREKRFLGFLIGAALGITGAALSMRNSYGLNSLTSKINAVQTATEVLAGNAKLQSKDIGKLQMANEHIFHFLHHGLQSIRDMVARTQCHANQYAYEIH